MENQEEESKIIGYLVSMRFREDDIPFEDRTAIFDNAMIRIFFDGRELYADQLIAALTGSPLDIAFFNKFFPVDYGRPSEVKLEFYRTVRLSQEVRIDGCIFEVTEGGGSECG